MKNLYPIPKFQSFRFISKRHMKLILPEFSDINQAQHKYGAMYNADKPDEIIAYVYKGEVLTIRGYNATHYFVENEYGEQGLVLKRILDIEPSGKTGVVARTSGLSNSELNLLLTLYSLADRSGYFEYTTMVELAAFAQIDSSSLYRALNFFMDHNIISVDKENKLIHIKGFSARSKDGYFKVSTRFFSKKFLNLSLPSKRLSIYLLSLQIGKVYRLSQSKMMAVTRQNTSYKLKRIFSEIRDYFLFDRIRTGMFMIQRVTSKFDFRRFEEHYNNLYAKLDSMLSLTGLYEKVDEKERYRLVHLFNRVYLRPSQFHQALSYASKQQSEIKTSLAAYVAGILKNEIPHLQI